MAIVYLITSPSGKEYVGYTSQTLTLRWQQHCCDAKGGRTSGILHKSIRKHGAKAFTKQILSRGSASNMLEREVEEISARGTLVPGGYNLTSGGERWCPSASTRSKMSESAKRRCQDPVVRNRLRDNLQRGNAKRWASDNPGGATTKARKAGALGRRDVTSPENIKTIRRLRKDEMSYAAIARATGVEYTTVRNIALGLRH